MIEVMKEALLDSFKALPILLLVYLLIEFLEHKNSVKFEHMVSKNKKAEPLVGSFLGVIPQCGFSSIMADLYSRRIITIGTLFAVFIATSDEAFAILITQPNRLQNILILIGVKLICAIAIGYLIDLVFSKKHIEKNEIDHHEHEHHKEEHDCGDCSHNELHHKHELVSDKDSSDGILKEALHHTIEIFVIILISNIILGTLVHLVGMNNIKDFITNHAYLQYILSPLIGLIPSCAGSVILVELYTSSIITFAATLGGLIAGSGVGIIVLYKRNKNIKENVIITISLYLIGLILGLFLTIFNI